jgi:hypothetical protein
MQTRTFVFKFILFLFVVYALFACTNKKEAKEDITVEHFEWEVEQDGGPDKKITPTFKTVKEWLHFISANEKPNAPDLDYNFGLSESPNEYILNVGGVKTYDEGKYRTVTRVEWRPENMYLLLPESEYRNLKPEQVRENIFNQLKAFTQTTTFKNSFFSKAKAITADWEGDTLWTK